ncbi:MAG: peptidase [Nitrosomonas sp.]|nr:type II toxin-antitoxin system RelE/ParE family toxin [Nitrosomonas sp.]OQW84699.1 MAG: peptidase [Proteobacteria bacterium ST_bin16]TXI41243.1 MAG: peptidase [Nitrosomonas sp.]
MIKSFRHSGLEQYFLKGIRSGILVAHERRIQLILSRLHASISPQDMDLPGLRLHKLTGKRKETWSVSVSGNWRITFELDGKDAIAVNYEDYH